MKTIIAAYSGLLRGTGSSIFSTVQDLPSIPWLTKSRVERHLQIISVLQWVLSFLAMGVACTVILLYIFCTDCWLIAALYLAWLVFDWNTPNKGGRRSSWVRNWAMWRYFRDYFPIRLVKTHNLLPSRNYIFGYHPHGIMCLGGFCNFGTEATGVSKKFPGIKPYLATLAGNFRLPVLRDYLMSGGICPVNRDTIDYILSKNGTGNAVVIVVGGAGLESERPFDVFILTTGAKTKLRLPVVSVVIRGGCCKVISTALQRHMSRKLELSQVLEAKGVRHDIN
ncbi:diacylglycerol O-acyltransferase 2 [Dendropsophus ebraccatus]|uniref:diacylglycerol O-acyltransferase 2 n=1 Tax=Dendropsophus ebraccatus TaxID=150705 RepID=UPI003831D14B